MFLSKTKKGFTIAELLIGMFVISTILISLIPSIKIYLDMYIKSEEKNTGEIYNLAYDIQKNKSYGKRFTVSDEQDFIKIHRSESCFVIYKFYKEEQAIKKMVTCTPEEHLDLDNSFILSSIKEASFTKGDGFIKLDLKAKNENFSHNFIF